ncbi:hypothetical protein F0266_14875 [Vibrio coralliilyticus]|uniref:hypothetical protein n=1 Tax=Vibrio coralliilyticus TaxID=190893 RepID=UPI00148DFCFA|nr:hypothetical protein [Vibrio coralliilyticus]NOH54222.1 hypothetical protein [Vibrio coralliilyticus]
MKKHLITTALLLLFSSFSVNAGTIDCGYQNVTVMYVQSERSDGSVHGNKLLMRLVGDCPDYGYVSNTDPAFSGMLSLLMAVKMNNQKVRVVVNDGPLIAGAARIEFLNLQ